MRAWNIVSQGVRKWGRPHQLITPFNGTYCSMCTCKYGECCKLDPTTPNKHGRYGCKCPEGSKRFGHMCDKCNTIDSLNGSSYCNSTCKTNYFGQNLQHSKFPCFSKLAYANNNSICNFLRSDGGALHAMGMENAFKANANATRDGSATKHLDCQHCKDMCQRSRQFIMLRTWRMPIDHT